MYGSICFLAELTRRNKISAIQWHVHVHVYAYTYKIYFATLHYGDTTCMLTQHYSTVGTHAVHTRQLH